MNTAIKIINRAMRQTGNTMTTAQYLKAIERLGLTPSGKATALSLGVTVRTAQGYASGEHPIPEPVAKLIRCYLEHGLPKS